MSGFHVECAHALPSLAHGPAHCSRLRNADERKVYCECFQMNGYAVVAVSSTDDAVPHLATSDLLITGLMLPGKIFPIELIEGATRGRWGKRVPVIVVTGSTLGPFHEAAEEAGAACVLVKPSVPQDLLGPVAAVLARQPQGDPV